MSDIEPIPGAPVNDPRPLERRVPREDRRSRPTPMISRYLFRGRRRHVRRQEDSQIGYYVDRQTPFELVAVSSLFALTLTDALATLHILGKGGTELNPIMRSALEVGDHYFLITKLGISLLGGCSSSSTPGSPR